MISSARRRTLWEAVHGMSSSATTNDVHRYPLEGNSPMKVGERCPDWTASDASEKGVLVEAAGIEIWTSLDTNGRHRTGTQLDDTPNGPPPPASAPRKGSVKYARAPSPPSQAFSVLRHRVLVLGPSGQPIFLPILQRSGAGSRTSRPRNMVLKT
jgi:hypothetical protein